MKKNVSKTKQTAPKKQGVEQTENNSELIHELETLHEEVHKQNSRGRIFMNGIISGLGRTIGATIIFAIIITLLSYIIRISDAEWITALIDWFGLSSYLD